MALPPISNPRISLNLKAGNLLRTIRANQYAMFRSQNQLATGLRFQAPSEDPTRAAAALKLDRTMDTLKTISANVQTAGTVVAEGETAMQEAVDLIRDAHTLALQAINDVSADDERRSLSSVASSSLDRLITVANRKYLDTYLFSGRYGDGQPFEMQNDGVLYHGDDGKLQTAVENDYSWETFTVPGSSFFSAVSSGVQGWADLNPSLTADTLISDLAGATGTGVSLGRITVTQGAAAAEIDLSGAVTVGDIIDRLNAEMPPPLQAMLTSTGINIAPSGGPGDVMITDANGGRTAVDLGIFSSTRAALVAGADLNPRLTGTTTLAQLNGGAGLNLAGGITIRNGDRSAIILFNGTDTVEDALNRINLANVGVWARISEDGSKIDVLNRLSGSDLRIEEFGGSTASSLGIRSLHAGTLLSSLNDGLGIDSVDGTDFRITTAGGATFDIDVNAVDLRNGTLQDVINLINSSTAGAVSASLTTNGNGIVLTDNTIGGGTLSVTRLNVSPAMDGLGLDVAAVGNTIQGRDVNPVRVNSPFTALLELRQGLESNDTRQIELAGQRLEDTLTQMQRVQGELAAKDRVMVSRGARIEDAVTQTQLQQSDVRDADMTEAIVRFQQFQTALEANMASGSKLLSLSLMDYLR